MERDTATALKTAANGAVTADAHQVLTPGNAEKLVHGSERGARV